MFEDFVNSVTTIEVRMYQKYLSSIFFPILTQQITVLPRRYGYLLSLFCTEVMAGKIARHIIGHSRSRCLNQIYSWTLLLKSFYRPILFLALPSQIRQAGSALIYHWLTACLIPNSTKNLAEYSRLGSLVPYDLDLSLFLSSTDENVGDQIDKVLSHN